MNYQKEVNRIPTIFDLFDEEEDILKKLKQQDNVTTYIKSLDKKDRLTTILVAHKKGILSLDRAKWLLADAELVEEARSYASSGMGCQY